MSFTVGSLVQARGREWVVLPESSPDLLMLKPLGGRDEEVTGILPALESVAAASFDLPDPPKPGDFRSARLLREAARLGFRGSAGPFRSFGRIAVEPRHYQLVPLLVALKQDPMRILIADDVGIGKTIEACLVARELLDRGEASRLAVPVRRISPSSGSRSCARSSTSTPSCFCPAPCESWKVSASASRYSGASRTSSSPSISSSRTATATTSCATAPS
jgi:hypothetical protein